MTRVPTAKRCAVYTRKSTPEELHKDDHFLENSATSLSYIRTKRRLKWREMGELQTTGL